MAKLHKEASGFTQVKNELLNDPKLSWKSKGVFAYLFSKPDDWDFSADRIAIDGVEGRKAVLSALKELETSGYLSRSRKGDGRVDYYLAYSKNPKSPHGTVPKQHRAQTAPISNKDSESNKDLVVTPSDSTESRDISDIMELFRIVNPTINSLFKNKTQRQAIKNLLKLYPRSELFKIVTFLEHSNKNRFAPTITTPLQLERDLGRLIAFVKSERWKRESKGKDILGL